MIHSARFNIKQFFLVLFILSLTACSYVSAEEREHMQRMEIALTDILGVMEYDDRQEKFLVSKTYRDRASELLKNAAKSSPEQDLVVFVINAATHEIVFQETASGKPVNNEKLVAASVLVKDKPSTNYQPTGFTTTSPALFNGTEPRTYYGAIQTVTFKQKNSDLPVTYHIILLESLG